MQQNNLGKFIKEKRLAAGKTLNAFAYSIDVEPAIISRVENCKQDIKFEVLRKIAMGLDFSLTEFIKEYELYEQLKLKNR